MTVNWVDVNVIRPHFFIAPGIFSDENRIAQTVSHFGFTKDELTGFASALGGRGVDRIVPFGSALAFSAIWDGYDLLAEFSRLVNVRS